MSETLPAAGVQQAKAQDRIQLLAVGRFHCSQIVPGGGRHVKPSLAAEVISGVLVNDRLEVGNVGRSGALPGPPGG